MAVARPFSFEVDFVRNPISGSAAWFFVIFLKFIFTSIFEIKINEKNSWVSLVIQFYLMVYRWDLEKREGCCVVAYEEFSNLPCFFKS